MNWNALHSKLINSARHHPPSEQVPLAFEKRIMARCRETPRGEDVFAWVRALWCGASACAAVALLVSVWSFLPVDDSAAVASFSQEFEQTILASADEGDSAW